MEMCASTFADTVAETWEPAARKAITRYTVNSQQQQRHNPATTTTVLSKEQQHITKASVTYACGRHDGDDDDDDDDDDDITDEKEDGMEARVNDHEDDGPCTHMRGILRIRCVVDHVRGAKDFTGGGSCDVTEVEKEDDVIVASDTLLADLVQVALSSLGYSLDSVFGAQGAIQLKNRNWKPLPFDVITDDKTATIHDVLGDGKDFILRLRVPTGKKSEAGLSEDWRDSSVRHAVLSLLKHHSQSALAKLSPLSQSTISTIANKQYKNRLSHKKCQAFGRWYSSYVGDIAKSFVRPKSPHNRSPVVSQTTFHPVNELPLLRSWFQTYPNPTNTRFNMFARILNSGHVRHNRPKISPQKIKIWWRNERSQQRKHQPQAAAAKSTKRAKAKVSSTVMVRPASECKRRRNVLVCSKTVSHVSKSVRREMKGVVAGCEDSFKPKRKDVAVQHELSKLRSGTEEGEVPELPCISSSTDGIPSTNRKIPALVPGSTTTEAELPQQEGSSPSPPSLPHAQTHTPHQAKTFSKQVKKNPDMTFTFQGQGHALLPGQPPSTWQSSFMSWSSHKKSVQDRAAAVSSESAFLLPAWPQYLPFIVPHQDRSRSMVEQEVISSSSGCGFDAEVEHYRYSQDLPFRLPSTHF